MADDRVLIVGGGLAGLAAACALRSAGVESTVFERVPELKPAGSVVSVLANSARGLEEAGLGELIQSKCVPVQRLEYLDWHGRYLAHMPISEVASDLGTRTYIALRTDLQLGMYEALGDDIVKLGADCTGFTQDAAGVSARFEGGREETGAVLLAADGVRSAIRRQLLGDAPKYAGYTGWRGIATMDPCPLEPGQGRQFFGRGRTFGTFGFSESRMYWFSTRLGPEGGGDSPAGRKADVRETFEGAPELVQQVIEATPEDAILRTDIYERPPVERWGEGRVTMLGDAAHAATPNTGQGGSQALLDGVVIAKRIAAIADRLGDAGAVRATFAAYEADRIPQTAKVTKEAGLVGTFVHWQNPVACLVRDQVMYKLTPKRTWRKRANAYLAPNL